jgi:hypothetical protein
MWCTADGRLAHDGDPDALFLAYKAGDTVPIHDVANLPGPTVIEPAPPKQRQPAANKARTPGADK